MVEVGDITGIDGEYLISNAKFTLLRSCTIRLDNADKYTPGIFRSARSNDVKPKSGVITLDRNGSARFLKNFE
jgi:hypothetical protein